MSKYVKHPYDYAYMTMTEGLHPQIRKAGEAIKLYRKMTGMSRQELADLVNPYAQMYNCRFTYADIYGYETYRISPKIDKLTALCRATGFDAEFFTGYKDAVILKQPMRVRRSPKSGGKAA